MTAITLANLHDALREVDAWVDAYPADTVLALWEAEAWKMLDYASWEALCESRGWTKRISLPRPERREIVSTLRQEGMSTRAIAAATQPRDPSTATGPLLCTYCAREWPCPDRAAVGTLLPDPSNRLLRHLTGEAS
jgi:hypothetical protein